MSLLFIETTAFGCSFVRRFMDALLRAACGPWASQFWIAAYVGVAAAVCLKCATLPSLVRLQPLFDYRSSASKAILLAGIVGAIYAFALSFHYRVCMIPKVENAFLSGAPNVALQPCYQNRTAELPPFVLHPAETTANYYLVEGAPGCGKTTILREACFNAGPGVMYFSVPLATMDFGIELAKHINFEFVEGVSAWQVVARYFADARERVPTSNYEATMRVLDVISKAAVGLKTVLGHPAVLVIDNVARLAHQDPEMLHLLQDFAERRADDGTFVVRCMSGFCSLLSLWLRCPCFGFGLSVILQQQCCVVPPNRL